MGCNVIFILTLLNMLFAIKIHKKIVISSIILSLPLRPCCERDIFTRRRIFIDFFFHIQRCNITHCGILSSSPTMSLALFVVRSRFFFILSRLTHWQRYFYYIIIVLRGRLFYIFCFFASLALFRAQYCGTGLLTNAHLWMREVSFVHISLLLTENNS